MGDLPKCAMELVGGDPIGIPTYRPIEAPPCGARLDIDERHVHLECDRIAGHQDEDNYDWTKHRAVIDAAAGYALHWCDDDCAHRCDHVLANELSKIREHIQRGNP